MQKTLKYMVNTRFIVPAVKTLSRILAGETVFKDDLANLGNFSYIANLARNRGLITVETTRIRAFIESMYSKFDDENPHMDFKKKELRDCKEQIERCGKYILKIDDLTLYNLIEEFSLQVQIRYYLLHIYPDLPQHDRLS